jgi:predicted Ser/Thr protein kinase
MYTELVEKLIEAGYTEDSANRIAEIITDYGWEFIRDILNEL